MIFFRKGQYLAKIQLLGIYLESEGAKQTNQNIEKITLKFDPIKFLALHITNQKFSFYIFKVGNVLNIFMEHDLYLLIILNRTICFWLLLQLYLCCL